MVERPMEGPRWTDERVLELVREHERLVCGYLRSLGCPGERVEDLAQETFLRLFTRPQRSESGAALRGYLCTTARNLYINSLRADASAPDVREIEQAWSEFDRADGGEAYVDALRDCLDLLTDRAREALSLRYGERTSRQAIAGRLDLSLGGLKSLIQRSKQTLKDCIQRKLGVTPFDAAESVR